MPMLGPIGSNLMLILRVLTPSEIERYSDEQASGENPVALAAGAENLSTSQHQSGSTLTNGNKKQQNTLTEEDDELKAKIIPINEKVKKELKEKEQQQEQTEKNNFTSPPEPLSGESSGLESIGVLSRSQMAEIEAKKLKQENDKKESTTVFILNQREKLKSSQNKLAEQAAILQYRKNASQEFIKHEVSDEDFDEDNDSNASGSCGILVNKKHY
jgi:hypothetical protein